jgi:glycosyltransferase involved in cell wall biosynthesis
VASDCDGIPEDVTDRDSALLVPPGDPHALAEAMRTLLGDRALRDRLGARAREVYEERFSAERFRAAVATLYSELGFTPCGPAPAP